MKRLLFHAVLVCFACCFFFSNNLRNLFCPYDGSYRMEVFKYNFEWTHPTLNSSITPLQGLGNIAYPINGWLSPAALTNYYFFNHEVSPLLIYTIITLELFFEIYWLGSCLQLARSIRLLAAWLAILVIMPFHSSNPGGFFCFYPISSIIPDIVESIAMVCLILGLITRLDLNRFPRSVLYSLAVSFGILYFIIRIPVLSILGLPIALSFSAYWLALQLRTRKTLLHAGILGLLIYLPLLLPFIFVIGCFIEAPAVMIPADYAPPLRTLGVNISLLFSACKMGWIGSILYLTGLAGAAVAIATRQAAARTVALFYIGYSLLVLTGGLLFTFVFIRYRAPYAIYYEWFTWPFMFLYTALLLQAAGQRAHALLAPILNRITFKPSFALIARQARSRFTFDGSLALTLGCAIGLLICAYSALVFERESSKADLASFPPVLTAFNQDLVRLVGLSPGSAWKGCVATLTGNKSAAGEAGGTSWPEQSDWDFKVWSHTGSEYRGVCLWWLNIPTLFVYNPNMSADYYFLVTRLFSTKDDAQMKEVTVLSRPNIKLLRLFGVKVLVSDRPLPPDPLAEPIVDRDPSLDVYAYELKDSNISGFSPLKLTTCSTAQAIIARLTAGDFDPVQEGIVQENISPALTPADHRKFIWGKNKVIVKADAPGMCLEISYGGKGQRPSRAGRFSVDGNLVFPDVGCGDRPELWAFFQCFCQVQRLFRIEKSAIEVAAASLMLVCL
jgi:hypothetical protein